MCLLHDLPWFVGPERSSASYRVRSAERIAADVARMVEQTGVRTINLSNDALSPRDLRKIGHALADIGRPVTWDTEIRLEKSLKRDVLSQMYDGGCRHLRFGFESAVSRSGLDGQKNRCGQLAAHHRRLF